MSGRGGGKTLALVLQVLRVCLDEPGTRGAVLSPTYGKLRDIFLSAWIDIIPRELYKLNRSEMTIQLCNGSFVYLRSRHVENPSRGKVALKGLDISWVVDDEAAEGFDIETTTNSMACCRRPGRHRFYCCVTTPLLNDYYKFATKRGHKIVYSSSFDNPYISRKFIEDLEKQMSPQQARREIYGEWVELEGLVWNTWKNELWPNGNIHKHVFDPSYPWFLWMDIGVGNGAYLVVQSIPAERFGQTVYDGNVWIIVAQLMPERDGSVSRALQRLHSYGNPSIVVVGADINTRSQGDARTPMYFANQAYPGTPVHPIDGWMSNKQIQYDRVSAMILDVRGERRLCVSEDIHTIGGETGRGIMELVQQDTWPENSGKVRGQFLAKDGRLEHVRDALLYGCVHTSPASFGNIRKTG